MPVVGFRVGFVLSLLDAGKTRRILEDELQRFRVAVLLRQKGGLYPCQDAPLNLL